MIARFLAFTARRLFHPPVFGRLAITTATVATATDRADAGRNGGGAEARDFAGPSAQLPATLRQR